MPLAEHKPTDYMSSQGPPCSTARLLETLADDDRDELLTWLDNPHIGHSAIADALAKEGHRLSHQQISWHRRGKCKCRHKS
jgi:hypothetical protein